MIFITIIKNGLNLKIEELINMLLIFLFDLFLNAHSFRFTLLIMRIYMKLIIAMKALNED